MKTITYDDTKYTLVPIEPTEEMLKAAYHAYEEGDISGPYGHYKTMLSAAPTPATEAQAGVPDGWQPIETAPKTGRAILLGYFNSHGNWRTLRGQWFSQEEINESWEEPEDCDGLEGWYETSVESDDIPNCWATEPTHWMPLPKPPVIAAAQKGEGE